MDDKRFIDPDQYDKEDKQWRYRARVVCGVVIIIYLFGVWLNMEGK